jgi:hypothetical protein
MSALTSEILFCLLNAVAFTGRDCITTLNFENEIAEFDRLALDFYLIRYLCANGGSFTINTL